MKYMTVDNSNADVLKGYEYSAAMCLNTPLEGLIHHKELRKFPVKKLPLYCDERYGIWLPKTKSWAELNRNPAFQGKAEQIDENIPQKMIWSDVGEITEDGANYIHFLKEFRNIVESDKSPDHKMEQITALGIGNKEYQQFIDIHFEKNTDWMEEYLGYESFLGIDGIGTKVAKSLYEAGYTSKHVVMQANDKELLKIKGVGKAKVCKIKKLLS